jgi:uncharacterized protein (TIGR02246 family)
MAERIQQATFTLADALVSGDPVAAAALYTDDGRLLTPAAELIAGRREIEAYWRAGIGVGLAGVELRMLELQLGRELAIEIGRDVFAVDGDGGTVAERGKYLVLHRRQPDGSWRRAVDVFNPDVPEPARRRPEEEQ